MLSLNRGKIGDGTYEHTYCIDYLRKDCGLKHLDLNGESHFRVLQATRCEPDGYAVIAVRDDKYKVKYSLIEDSDSGEFVFKSERHPDAIVTVTEVRSFVHQEKNN